MKARFASVLLGAAAALLGPQLSHADPHAPLALIAPASSSAETRAWSVAKGALPAGLVMVAGVNGQQLRASKLFQQVYPMLLARRDIKEGVDELKSVCNIDLIQSIDSAVIGMQARQKGVIVLALSGVDQPAVTSCIVKLGAAQDRPQKISAKQQGNMVEFSASGDKDKVYMTWLAKDVVAFAIDPTDKSLLKKLTSGGLRGDSLGKLAGALKTDAALWAATTKSDQLPGVAHAKLTKAMGYADFNAGNLDVDVHAVFENAAAASAQASTLNAQLDAQRRGNPLAAPLLKTVKITSSGPELIATGSFPENELLGLTGILGGIP